jgi:hypothetical protein
MACSKTKGIATTLEWGQSKEIGSHALDVLALLIRMSLVCALPWHIQCLLATFVQWDEQVGTVVSVANVDFVGFELLNGNGHLCRYSGPTTH